MESWTKAPDKFILKQSNDWPKALSFDYDGPTSFLPGVYTRKYQCDFTKEYHVLNRVYTS